MQEKSLQQGEISSNLKKLIQRTHWKQVTLARALGVSPVTVSRWTSGSSRISREYIEAIASTLGVSVREITGDEIITSELTSDEHPDREISPAEWRSRALIAEAKLKHLQEACTALGQHVSALGCTVQSFSAIISE